ncbi:hypothetical protein BST12_16640 [Mycobacterium angelicum]|uniref:Uncharacterized protein n=1 Tax=Mycobacterium angelicum TaxID=470074 RepID=A0A1W9ZP53_MYCAN|nr:hypothetical protein BST12_16640 [Mycobacterium angelicum]
MRSYGGAFGSVTPMAIKHDANIAEVGASAVGPFDDAGQQIVCGQCGRCRCGRGERSTFETPFLGG